LGDIEDMKLARTQGLDVSYPDLIEHVEVVLKNE